MQLGIYTFGDIALDGAGSLGDPGQTLRDVLERARLAEEVGLDYVGLGEHHRPEYAISQPAVVIAAALAQTTRIHVGSAVTVLSTEDPVRVYQQFATMDAFSGGRAELLAGRGSFIESYPLYGARLEDYDALYDEKLALLLALDDAVATGESLTWSGRFRPPLHDAVVLPPGADVPGRGRHLNLGVATGGNPGSSVRAGRVGLPVNYAIIGGRPASFAPLAELYRENFVPRRAGAAPHVTVSGWGFLHDDAATARETFYPYWRANNERLAAERGFAPPSRITYEATVAPGGAFAVGTADEVAEKVVALHGALGHDRQIFQMDLYGLPQADQLRSIELLGTRVKPLVDAALG